MEESSWEHLLAGSSCGTSVLGCQDLHKKLESTVFNSVSLGQWESARASLKCLARSGDKKVCDTTRELLKVLILDSSNYWSESSGIPSPHHLSWLALDAYKTFYQDGDSCKLPDYVGTMIEFRLLLYQVRSMLSFTTRVANFLCQYHSKHVLQVPGTSYDSVPTFSSDLLAFLHDVITMQDPTLGHALITSLTVSSSPSGGSLISVTSQHSANNESLQCIYLDCISECLEALEALKAAATAGQNGAEDSDSQYESDHASSTVATAGNLAGQCEKAMSMIYTLLSMIEAQPSMMRFTKKIDALFAILLQASYPMGKMVKSRGQDKVEQMAMVTFEPGRIYACLIGRCDGFLISRLYEVEDYLRRKRVAEEASLASQNRYGSLPRTNTEVGGDVNGRDSGTGQRSVVATKDEWKDRFYDAMYDNKHLLESVLERGLQLIHTGHLQEVSRLLEYTEFIPLRPVLLLLGWDRYNAAGSGKELLDALWPMEVSMKQSLLYSGCCKMAFQVELVQWCLDKAQPQVHRCAGDMFKGLKSHSTLYVLHHSTPLASLDPLEVVDILKMRPRVPSRSSLMSPPPQFSRGITPLKPSVVGGDFDTSRLQGGARGVGGAMGGASRMIPATLKPEQERDISIFRSFCALKLVLDALWNAVLLRDGIVPCYQDNRARQSTEQSFPTSSDEHPAVGVASENTASSSDRREPKKAARKLDLGSEEFDATLAEENLASISSQTSGVFLSKGAKHASLARHRKAFVTDLLQEAKLYLAHIYPLTYRLEILEDVFSVLFVTSNSVRLVKNAAGGGVDFDDSSGCSASYGSGNLSSFVALLRGRNEFLVDEEFAFELLEVLQDCIRELRAAKYALQQTESSSSEGASLSFDGVRSSISEGSLNGRTMRLEQYVNEARWRHQMVLSEQSLSSPTATSPSLTRSSMKGAEVHSGGVSSGLGSKKFSNEVPSSSGESDSGWGASDSEEQAEDEGVGDEKAERESDTGSIVASGKPPRRKRRGRGLTSSLELKDDGSESVGSRTTIESGRVQRPLSRGSSVSSHPGSMSVLPSHMGRKSPSPRPLSAITTPAPRPPGFTTTSQKRSSPTAAAAAAAGHHHKQVSKQKSNSSLSSVSKSSTLESKSRTAGTRPHSSSFSDSKQPSAATKNITCEEEDSGECADVEERSPRMSMSRKQKKKRTRSQSSHFAASRKRRLQLSEQSSEPKPSRSSIVSRMLSSSGSLLRVCLRHSNYMKAGEVVQTLHMEGKFGEAVIHFAEQFEEVGQELSQHSRGIRTPSQTKRSSGESSVSSSHFHSANLSQSNTPPIARSSPPKLSFSYSAGSQSSSSQQPYPQQLQSHGNQPSMNLQIAIMNARTSYDPLQRLHQLLAPPTVHRMLFSGDAELESVATDNECLSRLSDHVPSLIMLDLVCGRKISGAIALKIIEMAQDRLGGVGSGSLAAQETSEGPFALLRLISDASVHFPQATISSRNNSVPSSLIPQPHVSPHALLTATTHSLTLNAISLMKTFSDSYREAREKLEMEINSSLAEIKVGKNQGIEDVFGQLTQLVSLEETMDTEGGNSSSGSNGAVPFSPLRQQTSPQGSIFDELVRALHSMPSLHAIYSESVLSHNGTSNNSNGGKEKPGQLRQRLELGAESGGRSYLWQFSRYIRRFIELVVKCLGMKTTNLNKGSLVLSVMKETPYRMLGRLIFELGISPQKLEAMMGDFPHLPIVAVLTKCCCPEVSGRGLPLKTAVSRPTPVLALNEGRETSYSDDDLCDLSHSLLSKLLSVLKDQCGSSHSQESLLFPGDLAGLYKSPEVQEVLRQTSSLSSVDLTRLKSIKRQMIFYTNILNLLYLHALLYYSAYIEASSSDFHGDNSHGDGDQEGCNFPASLRGITLSMMDSSRVVQMALFGKVGYRLGQLGLVSCLDLHYSVLCHGLTPPTIIREAIGADMWVRLSPISPDPWTTYAPTCPDPRLFYVIHDGQLSSFLPIPLNDENFEPTLASNQRRYIANNVSIEHGKRVVVVSTPLLTRKSDFTSSSGGSGQRASETPPTNIPSHISTPDILLLLRYLQEHLEPTKADILKTMLEMWETSKNKHIQVKGQEMDCALGYNFSPADSIGLAAKSLSPGKASPKSRRRRSIRDASRKEASQQPAESPSHSSLAVIKEYSLTAEMMEFVKEQKPLLVGLIALVCPSKAYSGSKSLAGGSGAIEESIRGSGGRDTPSTKEEEPRSFMKSFRSRVASPIPISQQSSVAVAASGSAQMVASSLPVSPTRSSLTLPRIPGISDVDSHTSLWRRQYNEIIAHFPVRNPMSRYLEVRILPFEGVIPWALDAPSQQQTSDSSATLKTSKLDIASLALAPPSGEELEEACIFVMKSLVESGNVASAIRFLSSEPAVGSSQVHALSHMALCCHFVTNYIRLDEREQPKSSSRPLDRDTVISKRRASKGEQSLEPINPIPILSQLSDPECASRLTMASLQVWSIETCVDMLEFCLHHLPASSSLAEVLSGKLEKMRVYSRIMVACEVLVHGQGRQRSGRSSPWKNWKELAEDSVSKTDFVLGRLLDAKEFSLAREWRSVHALSGSVTRQIEVEYLFNLLEGKESNPIVAHQKLDSLPDERTSLEVCESLLQEKEHQMRKSIAEKDLKTMVFVLQYMLTRLSVSLANKPEYSCKLLGAKALLCLPSEVYSDYSRYLATPLLMVEQLIMDLKIEWAAAVIKKLRSTSLLHVLSTDDTPSSCSIMKDEEGRGSVDPFSRTLVFYCSKALDFHETILTSSTPAPSVPPSVASTRPSTPTIYSTHYHYSQAGRNTTPTVTTGHARRLSQDQFPPATPRVPVNVSNRSGSITGMATGDYRSEMFQPPPEPPPKDRWEKDVDAKECRLCRGQFGMFMRRHHCRRCGRVVCATCSAHNMKMKGYNRPVRTCDSCYQLFSPLSSSDTSGHHQNIGGAPGERGEGANSAMSGGGGGDSSGAENFPPLQSRLEPSDKMANEGLRSDFYYERTPNTALCLSLADLLVDKELSARLILDCCHLVSAKLVPDSQGCVNAELDHHFVINLIQNFLLNAKLRYADANLSSGVEMCDTYLSRVDLLRLLVTSRYNKIPSLQELTKPDLARRVRDRLIQDDRFSLAMEVSTKCQLDTVAVWSAWGLALLKCGEFSEARTKLQKCFMASSQSGASGQNLHLIQRILEQIEQKPLSAASRHTRLCEDWSGVVMGSTAITQRSSDECAMDSARFNECMFYLNTYASHAYAVSFFVKHASWTRACRHIIDRNCSSDVFVESLWIPVLKSGQVDDVMASMKELDPSLGVWEPHLTAACLFFTRKGLYSVLLKTQLFMNDYVRAGLTCVKFFIGFSGRATTISDLFDRLDHLDQATKYLLKAREIVVGADRGRTSMRARVQRAFDDVTTGGAPKGGSSPGVRSMSSSELNSHLETIKLQKEVVKHLYHSAKDMGTLREPLVSSSSSGDLKTSQSASGRMPMSPPPSSATGSASSSSSSSPSSSSGPQPPTLFGNSKTRAEVATLVITNSRDLETGFNLTQRIIGHYKINMKQVFCDIARGLAIKHRYGEMRVLLQSIQSHCQSKVVNMEAMNDDIVMAAIKELSKQTKEVRDHGKQVDKLVGLLIQERNKIKAFIQCGKLKSAYLAAVRAKMADEVQKISEIANKAGQLSVRDICDKWLQANAPYLLHKQ